MLGSVFSSADFQVWLTMAGAALILMGSVIAGYRLHCWIDGLFPKVGRYLPRDAGAWVGLAFGLIAIVY